MDPLTFPYFKNNEKPGPKSGKSEKIIRGLIENRIYDKTLSSKRPTSKEINPKTKEDLEKVGFQPFKKEMFEIEEKPLGEGSFGKVKRAIKKGYPGNKEDSFVALKYIKLTDLKPILMERSLMMLVSEKSKEYFPKYLGSFYLFEQESSEVNVILESEAGSCDFKKVIVYRKKKNEQYKPKELMNIVICLLSGLIKLNECRVYHSDIKPSNIIFNLSKNTLQYIDFGVSIKIPEGNNDICDFQEYLLGGTKEFFSPEKRNFYNNGIESQNTQFNPFKCDLSSLCATLLRTKKYNIAEKGFESNFHILKIQRKISWQNRLSVQELKKLLLRSDDNGWDPSSTGGIGDKDKTIVRGIMNEFSSLIKAGLVYDLSIESVVEYKRNTGLIGNSNGTNFEELTALYYKKALFELVNSDYEKAWDSCEMAKINLEQIINEYAYIYESYVYSLSGRIYLKMKDYKNAINALTQANLSWEKNAYDFQNHNYLKILFNLSKAYLYSNQPEDAKKFCKSLRELDDDNPSDLTETEELWNQILNSEKKFQMYY